MNKLLNRLVLWQKFALLCALSMLLLAGPLYLYLGEVNGDIDVADRERLGVEPLAQLSAALRAVQTHRSQSAGVLDGQDAMRLSWQSARSDANAAFERVSEHLAAADVSLEVSTRWQGIRDAWRQLAERAAADGMGGTESFNAHGELIARLQSFASTVADEFGLSYDPAPDGYHLVIAQTERVPRVVESIARMQALGVKVLSRRAMWADDSVAFANAVDALDAQTAAMRREIEKAMQASDPALEQELARATGAAGDAAAYIEDNILSAPELIQPVEPLYARLQQALRAQADLDTAVLAALDGRLEARVRGLKGDRLRLLIVVTLLVSAIAGLGLLVARSITGPMQRAVSVAGAIARGDLDNAVDADGSDESARMLAALGHMQDSLVERNAEDRRLTRETLRLKQGLDVVQTNVMVANSKHDIVYLNDSIREMLAEAEADIRKDLPDFRAERVLGSNIDVFHKHPEHQRAMLAKLTEPYKAKLKVGDRNFELLLNPILDDGGKRVGTVVEWQDTTARLKALNEERLRAQDMQSQLDAISKAQAVIEFDVDGTIREANENFLAAVGYSLDEIRGRHHRMFVVAEEAASTTYREFWAKLADGQYDSGQYRRVGKGGREIWIQASYNPILDLNGKPFKVVKYATDVTDQVLAAQAMSKAVEETQAVVRAAQSNDLTARIPMDDKDGAIAELCAGVNALLDSMVGIVRGIKRSSGAINAAAGEIASGNADLSQRTEQQAASLEETASSMEELTSTVRQNAENANQANQLAIGASDVASRGGEVVERVVSTMSEINESSNKVQEIISVIDGIAFQTNILALNAAVEAARAGEQGRGFAVVASEVRSLAQRSAAAAKEIKQLISDSVERVENGSELVSRAGETMTEILGSVKRVTDIMGEITAASQEQSAGIEQVNQTVAQMDEATQQNAALVEQASAAARSMEDQARKMAASVDAFSIGDDGSEPEPDEAPVLRRPMPARRLKDAGRQAAVASPKRTNGAAKAHAAGDEHWAEF